MAIILVANTLATGSASAVTTSAINTTGANLLVVALSTYTSENTLSDSKGNTWTKLTTYTATTNSRNTIYYCLGGIVGAGHTFTNSGGTNYPAIAVAAFSGVATTSALQVSGGNSSMGSSTSISTGTYTPDTAGSLILSSVSLDTGATMSVNSSMLITNQVPWVSAINMGVALAYKIEPATASLNATWTASVSANLVETVVIFRPAASGGGGGGGTYTNGYSYRKSINIDHTKVSGGDQANFPVFIDVTLPTSHVTSAAGYDVIVTDSAGTTLSFELDSYNSTTGQWRGWARVPTLSATYATILYVYYGKSSVTADQSTTGTWDSGYQTVYHLDDMADSTTNGLTLTDGATGSATGKIGNARSFDGTTTSYLTGTDIAFGGTAPITISAWINPSTISGGNRDIVAQGTEVVLRQVNTGIEWILNGFTGASDRIIAGTLLTAGSWTYVTASYSSTNGLRIFTDGVLRNSGTPTGSYANVTSPFRIGVLGTGSELFLGTIDEVRISSVERSSGWIATEYTNQSNPSAFYTAGTEEAAPSSSTGKIKVYTGVSFVAKPVKVWNGSAWVTKPLKRYNGSTWVTTNY